MAPLKYSLNLIRLLFLGPGGRGQNRLLFHLSHKVGFCFKDVIHSKNEKSDPHRRCSENGNSIYKNSLSHVFHTSVLAAISCKKTTFLVISYSCNRK